VVVGKNHHVFSFKPQHVVGTNHPFRLYPGENQPLLLTAFAQAF
jgi:hypothetical protein